MFTRDLRLAARILKQGGLLAYATEYCYGLGCDPFNRAAVLRLLHIKKRPVRKGMIVLAANVVQLAPYVNSIPDEVKASWPGPHTWLLPARREVPRWLTGAHDTIAVRVTAHPQAAALCRVAGMAIISTSANITGTAPARADREVLRRFGALIDGVLAGRVGDLPAPTPIRDATSGDLIRA